LKSGWGWVKFGPNSEAHSTLGNLTDYIIRFIWFIQHSSHQRNWDTTTARTTTTATTSTTTASAATTAAPIPQKLQLAVSEWKGHIVTF